MSLALCGLAGQDVTAKRFPAFNFSGRSKLKCLSSAAPGFHFWHRLFIPLLLVWLLLNFSSFLFPAQSTKPSDVLPSLALVPFWQYRTSLR